MTRIAQSYVRVKPKELDFSEETISRRMGALLDEVKGEAEDTFGHLTSKVKRSVQSWVEAMLGKEALILTGAERKGKHDEERLTCHSGCYERMLVTTSGTIWGLKVPKLRKKPYRGWKVLAAYAGHRADIDELIRGVFLGGVSTRVAGAVLKPILGTEFSAQHVSNALQGLDREVRAFHRRPITDDFLYLFFDGLTIKVRYGGRVRKKLVLACYGILADGRREIVDFAFAHGESQAAWETFVQSLYQRGLAGTKLRLISTDGNQGLLNALGLVYPLVPKQRCWAHKLRNVANKCPRKLQKAATAAAGRIYQAESKTLALRAFKKFKQVWGGIVPAAVACLEKDLEELLYFFDQPPELWKKVRTTNVIERAFREVRRRIRTFSSFTNVASCDRIVFGVVSRLNLNWGKRPLPEIAKCA